MMRAQVHSDEDVNRELSDSLKNYKYQTIDKVFADDIGDITLLNGEYQLNRLHSAVQFIK